MTDEIRARVEVTGEDIALGCRGDRNGCPIVLAIQRAVPQAIEVYVLYKHAHFQLEPDGDYYTAHLPPAASQFIEDFDRETGKAAPLDFDLSFAPRP
jgi:hypothetical protein